MRNFFLSFPIPNYAFQIGFGEKMLFLGSCFSDEIAKKSAYFGLTSHSNPFGTIFHPTPIGRFILDTINGNDEEKIFKNENRFYTWDASTIIYGESELELRDKIKVIREEWLTHFSSCKAVFITFGTSWIYSRFDNQYLVANCHKRPSNEFVKGISSVHDIVEIYNDVIKALKTLNPKIKIIFTVSPVRHIRDGLVENNQSKAILIEAVRQLKLEYGLDYFPSYEIVMDELRDYRFFSKDLVHPSQLAIDYVWERMIDVFCSEDTKSCMKKIDNFRKIEQHRPIQMSDEQLNQHNSRLAYYRHELLKENPKILL